MPHTWIRALDAYCYPVDLTSYERAHEFPGFFEMVILGDRDTTMAFENRYQEAAPHNVAAFFEVVYWKLYSQPAWCQAGTSRIVRSVQWRGVTATQLWKVVQRFAEEQTLENLRRIRHLLGIKAPVLAVALTLPALARPKAMPMVDKQVAKWVNSNAMHHSANRTGKLTSFRMNYTSLREDGFPSYLNWVAWCREAANVLTKLTEQEWRARDVEMAVFTAQRRSMTLNVLP